MRGGPLVFLLFCDGHKSCSRRPLAYAANTAPSRLLAPEQLRLQLIELIARERPAVQQRLQVPQLVHDLRRRSLTFRWRRCLSPPVPPIPT